MPRHTLIFPVSTLDLLMHAFLHFSFQDPRPRGLVKIGYFEDMCGIDPAVGPPAHDIVAVDIELVDWYLSVECQ